MDNEQLFLAPSDGAAEIHFSPEPPQLRFTVVGTPAPQGSKKGFYNKHTGRVNVVEDSKRVKPWREAVKFAALEERRRPGRPAHQTWTGPVQVLIRFILPRPKGHFGTGRNAGIVKASAPAFPATRPDLDKLERATLDALKEAQVYKDDGLVVTLMTAKTYPAQPDEEPGAVITVLEMTGSRPYFAIL